MSRVKQHTTPCGKCPFRRVSLPGWLGGLNVDHFRSLAQSEVRMPCHSANKNRLGMDYAAAQEMGTPEFKLPQCAGRAIHWANQIKRVRVPGTLLELPRDTKTVFEWPQEFIDHHSALSDRAALEKAGL